ncbi:hypothetical protein SB717_35310, partial [Priestia sp. SIMBA_032]|uniref:hypothetical protein n=1 Tax=Priestia sp. SIMBA_032 TaxID=3085775 RepID=UPI003979B6F2
GPLKHGAHSPRMYSSVALEIERDLKATPGLEYLFEREFKADTWAYCVAQARADLVEAWMDRMGSVEDWAQAAEGGVSSPSEEFLELSSRAST